VNRCATQNQAQTQLVNRCATQNQAQTQLVNRCARIKVKIEFFRQLV
jgi:hypothetical protein